LKSKQNFRHKKAQYSQNLGFFYFEWILNAVRLIAWHVLTMGNFLFALFLIALRFKTQNRWWCLATPFAMPIAVGNAYSAPNQYILVKILGCGCNMDGFNANDFSCLFFFGLLLITSVILILTSRTLKWKARLIYVVAGFHIIVFFCWIGFFSSMWL